MSIQRYHWFPGGMSVVVDGTYVRHADHEAAVAEAAEAAIQRAEDAALVHGALNERVRIRQAIEAQRELECTCGSNVAKGQHCYCDASAPYRFALAVIDGENT